MLNLHVYYIFPLFYTFVTIVTQFFFSNIKYFYHFTRHCTIHIQYTYMVFEGLSDEITLNTKSHLIFDQKFGIIPEYISLIKTYIAVVCYIQ